VEQKKSKHYREKTARENALQGIVKELNFPELTVEEIKFKIKAFNTWSAAEMAEVIKPQEKAMQAYTTFTYRNCFGSNKHIHSCVTAVFHEPECQQYLYSR
jgi:hypothetical protein